MKKILFIIPLILLISGCSSTYNLEIGNDSFKEDIDIKIDKTEIPSESLYEEIETDDQITPFLEENHYAFFSKKDKYYNKKVIYYDDYIDVNLSYNYSSSQFKDANSLNSCFENFIFDDGESYYIHVYGNFYCLYADEFIVNIKTNNKVIRSNATSVEGNIYTWIINNDNKYDVDIELEVSKGFPWKNIIKYTIILGSIVIVVFGAIYYVYNKNKRTNSID